MNDFAYCVIYVALIGMASFILGRVIPKQWFHAERFPFRSFRFEKEGRIYNKLKIRQWQNRVPDMSRILPKMMPQKKLTQGYEQNLTRMIQETCVAEWIHVLLSIAGLGCLGIWPGPGGVIAAVVYIGIGNIPFILIQRYNRPRLIRMQERLEKRRAKRSNENADLELQYGRGA